MYIDAGLGTSNPIILTALTSGPKFPRSWRVRISQIHCGSMSKADQGCLQYYSGVSGRIKSFNFDPSSGRQLSNQDYSICLRTERNFCSVQYSVCPDSSGTNRSRSFTLSGNSNTGRDLFAHRRTAFLLSPSFQLWWRWSEVILWLFMMNFRNKCFFFAPHQPP